MRGPGGRRGLAPFKRQPFELQSGRGAVTKSLARLPADPNAWSENDWQRPTENVNLARKAPVVLVTTRRVAIRLSTASRTRTIS